MLAALFLIISVVAFGQFAVYYWRAVMAGVAAEPLSDRVRVAARLAGSSVAPSDFTTLLNLNELTPGLREESGRLLAVRAYYWVAAVLGRLFGPRLPSLTAWSVREMTTCTRYVAVLVDQRLEHNLVCAAEIRSC